MSFLGSSAATPTLTYVLLLIAAVGCTESNGSGSNEQQQQDASMSGDDNPADEPEPATPEPDNQEPEPDNQEPEPDNQEPEPDNQEPEPDNQEPEPDNQQPQPGTGLCGAQSGQLFDDSYPWNQAVDQAPLDAESEQIIAYLSANHTDGQRFRIDGPSDEPNNVYGITVLTASSETPARAFEPTEDFYSPDCDPAPVPVPSAGAIEGETGFSCDGDGDCHLIVVDPEQCRLYEMWRADLRGDDFLGGCMAVWDLTQPYQSTLRGDCCTSADAAGLPIAAHMFNADEVASGVIQHALRFILPNRLMRERVYVRPATHSTGATSGPEDAPPYGARMRLKADVDLTTLEPAAQVVATALQTYGMILSDGGNLTFTATNDRFTTAKWADVGLGPNDLTSLDWSDFEVVELGERYVWDDACNCQRQPITD